MLTTASRLRPMVAAAAASLFVTIGASSAEAPPAVSPTAVIHLFDGKDLLGLPEATRQILFGAIILAVAAAYTRITEET